MSNHLPDCSMPDGAEPCKGFLEVQEERDRLKTIFDLRWKADMRAIRRWQDTHPGKELVWPDHADLVVWLMEQLEKSTVIGYIAANANEDKFRTWEPEGPAWTTDKKKAVVLLRREDAEAVFGEDEDTWKILPVTSLEIV